MDEDCHRLFMIGPVTLHRGELNEELIAQSADMISDSVIQEYMATARAAAVLLVRLAGHKVTLRAGALSERGFQTAVHALERYWPESSRRDINRYVGLSLDSSFYFLFAKHLPQGDQLLGLVFPLHTPLIRVRQDMTHAIRLFSADFEIQTDPSTSLEQSLQVNPPSPLVTEPEEKQNCNDQGKSEQADRMKNDTAVMTEWFHPFTSTDEDQGAPRQIGFEGQRNTAKQKPVDIDHLMTEAPWQSIEMGLHPVQEDEPGRDQPVEFEKSKPLAWGTLNENAHAGDDLVSILQGDFELRDSSVGINEWLAADQAPREERTDTPTQVPTDAPKPGEMDLEAGSGLYAVSDITFYLVPRSNAHFLVGELAHKLSVWFPDICEKYGWELDTLVVRPDYLKWTLRDFPEILIHDMLQIVRQQTTKRILQTFPASSSAVEVGDYWAAGYLVDPQNQDFSTQAMLSHVAKIRLNK